MTTRVEARTDFTGKPILTRERAGAVAALGTGVLRYALVLVLLLFGAAKFTAHEAAAIHPLVANSPLMGWLYSVLSEQGVSRLIGSTEIGTALLIAARPLSPRLSALGSAFAIGIFLTTLSFLFTTPGALGATHPAHGFLLKDIVLLGASIAIGGEALRAAVEGSGSRDRA